MSTDQAKQATCVSEYLRLKQTLESKPKIGLFLDISHNGFVIGYSCYATTWNVCGGDGDKCQYLETLEAVRAFILGRCYVRGVKNPIDWTPLA